MALFDFKQTYEIDQSPPYDIVTDEEIWRDVYNTGHGGENVYAEFRMNSVGFNQSSGPVGTCSYKLQYSEIGVGSPVLTWVDAISGSFDMSVAAHTVLEMAFITDAINTPLLLRLIITTTADANEYLTGAGTITVRMVGTIT